MNSTKKTTKEPGAGMLSPNRRPAAVRRRPSPRAMGGLLIGMISACVLIVILGALLLLLPMIRVQSVEISGMESYTYEEVLAASGIELNEEILLLDSNEIATRIMDACPKVNSCSVTKGLRTIKIVLEE